MTIPEMKFQRKRLDDVLVASARFRGEFEEVPEQLAGLRELVGDYVSGKAIVLHHYFDQSLGEGHDLEVCYPVRQAVETEEVRSWVLKGGEVLCAQHVGPRAAREAEGGLAQAWQQLFSFVRQHGIIPDARPKREVYLEETQMQGGKAGSQITELQFPFAFYRLDKLAEGVERHGGSPAREEVMRGSEAYPARSTLENAEWFRGAIDRLDAAIDTEGERRAIMSECADRFPPDRVQSLRAEYERLGDVDSLLDLMRADRTLGDRSWYEQPVREGNVVYVTKDPVLPEAYENATDEREKRSYYCHCGLMREFIRSGSTVSGTYCHCGAGWYHQLWEGILGQPVQIDVVASVLQGDDQCTFAIHLP
jgi:effector-binding domain-containing protein